MAVTTAAPAATWQVRWLAPNGDTIDLADGSRWIGKLRHGFGGTDFHEFTSRGVRQSGDTLAGLYAQPRQLAVVISMLPNRAQSMNALRARLAEAMNPDRGDGTLEYTDKQLGLIYNAICRAHPVHLDTAVREANEHQETLNWVAHDPLFYLQPAIPVSITANSGSVNINNTGSMPIGFTITIPGPLTAPWTLQNVSGGVTYSLTFSAGTYATGNTVKIVTLFNQKQSVIYPTGSPTSATDIFYNRGLGSIYWPLRRGVNTISLTTATGTEHSVATLTYNLAQLGV